MASYDVADVASTTHQGLMDGARHVIKRMLNPLVWSQMASYDVASTVHQSPTTAAAASASSASRFFFSLYLLLANPAAGSLRTNTGTGIRA